MVVGFGDTDAYGFHALEALQAIVEKRKDAETGVATVQAFRGPQGKPSAALDVRKTDVHAAAVTVAVRWPIGTGANRAARTNWVTVQMAGR